LGELEVAAIFSNGGKDRDMAQLFIVQFEWSATHDNVSHTELDQISHLIGRYWIAMSIYVFLLLGLDKAHLNLNQWVDLL
jgi:hypothetical protein